MRLVMIVGDKKMPGAAYGAVTRQLRCNEHYLSALVEIPQSGSAFYTLAGTAKNVATIFLAPGEGLSKKWRRIAEEHEHVICSIRADLGRSVSPDKFHRPTLLWALSSADEIYLWSASFSDRADEFKWDGIGSAAGGKRFQTTIETNPEDAPTWFHWVQRWKRKAALVRVYGPEIKGSVQ
jgi:hypothetical protein